MEIYSEIQIKCRPKPCQAASQLKIDFISIGYNPVRLNPDLSNLGNQDDNFLSNCF